MSERIGNWQQTFTGRQFWPCDPRPDEVCVEDIAHALSLQCRFAGHCRAFYSVGEHSVRVSIVAEALALSDGFNDGTASIFAFAGLLHDASEAYCIDVPRPLKPFLVGYREIEKGVMHAVATWSGLPASVFKSAPVKRADEILLMTEARDLMAPPPVPWTFAQGAAAEPLSEAITPWSPDLAESRFLRRYADLAARFNELRPRGEP